MPTIRIDHPQTMTHNLAISASGEPPSLTLEAAGTGTFYWDWEIVWREFSRRGGLCSTSNKFDLQSMIRSLGGDLVVRCRTQTQNFEFRSPIYGINPSWNDVKNYINSQGASDGFADIVWHESKGVHFRQNGQPISSFDGGYGLAQLTKPRPSFEEIWSWKLNIDAGLRLFKEKRVEAEKYLGSKGNYTPNQLKYETVCRWNGGKYHIWSDGKWVRNPNILCDGKTGNIGWNMADPDNAGKSEMQLRLRDKGSYSRGRKNTDEWSYFGICYADAILSSKS